jgi:hypothetical protein
VALFVQADISTRAGVDAVVRDVMARLGGLDILVNNVGGSSAPSGGVLALGDDDWPDALNANLLAAVRLDRAFLPGMLAQRSGASPICVGTGTIATGARGELARRGRGRAFAVRLVSSSPSLDARAPAWRSSSGGDSRTPGVGGGASLISFGPRSAASSHAPREQKSPRGQGEVARGA